MPKAAQSSEGIRPQSGPQTAFLQSAADIAIYGGAAGGGKSFALLLEPLRHVTANRKFAAIFFRRTSTQITNPGGLWDASMNIYGKMPGVTPHIGSLEWRWANGGKVKFSHLEHEISKRNHQGSEYPLECFDELTHFSQTQFWYLVSRNRSMSGIKGYVRATCNPDADSWVAEFIGWWINQETGIPIPERAGVLRWMIRVDDTLHWADSKQELIDRFRGKIAIEALMPKSVTFIPAKLTDNAALMRADPGYLANLLSLQSVERGRLLDGNWKIKPSAGLYFQRRWLKPLLAAPSYVMWVRAWDLAATPKTETNNPDFTESVLMGRTPDGIYILADHTSMRGSPSQVEAEILRTARQDQIAGYNPTISIPQDPAQAGKAQASAYGKLLSGYTVRTSLESRQSVAAAMGAAAKAGKIGRFGPFSSQCEAGNVFWLEGDWPYQSLFDKLEAFPEAAKDDAADACSRAFAQLGDNTYDSSLSWVDALSEL